MPYIGFQVWQNAAAAQMFYKEKDSLVQLKM